MIRRITFAALSILAVVCLFGQGANARTTYYPTNYVAVDGHNTNFFFTVGESAVEVRFYCDGVEPSHVSVITTQGEDGRDVNATCPVGPQVNFSFPEPQTFTIGTQTITVNPATFSEVRGRGGWGMKGGYSVSITVQ